VAEELRVKGLSQNETLTGFGTSSPTPKRPLLAAGKTATAFSKKARVLKRPEKMVKSEFR
jgi:hypothetical protein